MSLIDHTLFGDIDKVASSIAALRHFEPPEGYYFANSGGKDSTVVRDLLIRSGVKFDAHYHITTVDPPELVHFIRDHHPETVRERPEISMWRLIEKKMIPPTRGKRYCCSELKEHGGKGRLVVTGVRKYESNKRRKRQMIEQCYSDNSKRFLHPIFEWLEHDVWCYIKDRNLPYCELYDIYTDWPSNYIGKQEFPPRLFRRLGCVMCPQQSTWQMKRDAERWPKIADQYKRACMKAFDRLIERLAEKNEKLRRSNWHSGEDIFNWWISDKPVPKEIAGQERLFSDEGGVLFFEP